jgi:hypothetical protein
VKQEDHFPVTWLQSESAITFLSPFGSTNLRMSTQLFERVQGAELISSPSAYHSNSNKFVNFRIYFLFEVVDIIESITVVLLIIQNLGLCQL